MSKTILHIIDSLDTGGAEVLLASTVPSLTEFRHVVITLKNPNDFEEELKSFPQYCLNYKSKFDLFRSVKELREIITKHKIDLIHAHLLTSTFLARLAKPNNIPLIFSVHNSLSESAFKSSRLSKWLEKLTYKSKDHIIFVSNSIKNDYNKHIKIKGSFDVLPNFVEDRFFANFRKYKPKKDGLFKVVSVGTLKAQKNFSFLIQAFKHFNDCSLDIIGNGPLMGDLSRDIKKNEVTDRVNLLGKQSNLVEKLPEYDLFVMASTYEGFGIATVEAMALGIPTMLSDIEVFREVAGSASVYFKPHSTEDFISKLNKLKTSDKNLALLSKKGNERAQNISSKKNYLNKLSEIYNRLCP